MMIIVHYVINKSKLYMKKLFLLIVCAVLSIGARAQFSGSGNGTEADPYRIYTDIHLAQIANFLNQSGVYFELMKDVDLSSYIMENSPSQGWTPIGVESTPFMGILKGNGHTISGLMVNRPNSDHVGLFGYVNGARINDLTIKASSVTGRNYVSVLCGVSYGNCSFTNCDVEISNKLSGLCDVGGIVGFMQEGSTISDCDVKGNIESKAGSTLACGTVGGIGGTVEDANVSNCTYNGSITAKVKYAGGLIGSIHGCSLKNCTVKCPVIGEESVGGLCGIACETNTIEDCTQEGDITGTSNVSGGVSLLDVGSSNTFKNSHHKGTITNTGDYTGGMVAKSDGGCIAGMESCSHFGDIVGSNYIGGIIGASIATAVQTPTLNTYNVNRTYGGPNDKNWHSANINFYDEIVNGSTNLRVLSNCTNSGNISGKSYVGGIIGKDEVDVTFTKDIKEFTNNGYGYYFTTNGENNTWSYYGNLTYFTYYRNTNQINVIDCYSSGNIKGNEEVGGIVGDKEGGVVQNCYTYSNSISGTRFVGGIIGKAHGVAKNSNASELLLLLKSNVAICTSIDASESYVGRIYGGKADNMVNVGAIASTEGNRALTQTSVMLSGVAQDIVDNEQNGTSVGLSMLKLKGNYVSWGWNFDENWSILETESFPYKKYQAAPPVVKSKLEAHDTNISGQSLDGGTVYMYYKDREAVSTQCNGNDWTFETEPLQSGAQVQLYADVEGMTPSYLTSATVKYPGSGTEDDPWRIYTAEDLQGAINSGYYKVMNNINLTSWINENSPVKGWPAIGRNSSAATYIDGDNHTISGLWIDSNEGYNGLFSNYSAGYIKNLNVQVAEGKKVKGGDNTAILIGRMANAKIINCSVKGDVEGAENTGGLVGQLLNSDVEGSGFQGKVTGSGLHLGGLTGLMDNCNVSLCYSDGTINSTNTVAATVGGLVGSAINSGSISKSFANTVTTSAGTGECGGLVGHNDAVITECYSEGSVTSAGDYTGGLVGLGGNISNCYSTASVTGTLYTAGLVGYTYGSIDKCYATGNVNGVRYGAGLVGEMDGADAVVTNSVAANNLVDLTDQASWGCRVIGGFKNGAVEPTLGSNYALNTMQVSLNGVPQQKTDNPIEGVAKTEEELKSASTYVAKGWDFEKQWTVDGGYPVLKMEADVEIPEIGGDDTPEAGDDDSDIEPTDLSAYPNIVYTANQTLSAGKAFVLPIKMKNAQEDIVGFQCDIVLPSCIELEKNSRGSVKAPTFNAEADRTSTEFHTVSAATQSDGSVRVLCYSTANEVILGTDGTVCDFNATLAEETAPGQYAIKLKNITMTTAQSVKYVVDEATFVITIPAFVKGDANGDDAIDVADIAATANHILGNEAENFVEAAADMDEDEVIDVADIAGIANLILYGEESNVAKAPAMANYAAATPSLQVASFSVESGATSATPTLDLINPGYEFCGFQCDMYFPDGISWAKNSRGKLSAPTFNAEADRTSSEYHTVSAAVQSDGAVRILCYSNENEIFLGEEGAILNLPITFAEGLADGVYEVVITNIVLSRPTLPKVTLDEYHFTITVGNAGVEIALVDGTAINNTSAQQATRLTYTRNFKNTNWQPLYVPFSMTYEDWASQGLEVARLNGFYEYDDDKNGTIDRSALEVLMVTENDGALKPNHPYMVRANTVGEKTIALENVTMLPTEENSIDCSTVETKYIFTGTYSQITRAELNEMDAFVMSGGALRSSTSALNPMRWYMVRESRGGQLLPTLNEIRVFVHGEEDPTAIDFVNAENVADGVAYNVMGQRVNANARGIIIRNGKKFINK